MSSSEFVFGYIQEDLLPEGVAAQSNEAVIEGLPEVDTDGHPLIRSMFALPRFNGSHVWGQDGTRAIGFALHTKVFDPGTWLPKFEGLLKRLYWREARLHVKTEGSTLYRDYEIVYVLDAEALAIRNGSDPRPGQTWKVCCRWMSTGGHVDELGLPNRPGYTTRDEWSG